MFVRQTKNYVKPEEEIFYYRNNKTGLTNREISARKTVTAVTSISFKSSGLSASNAHDMHTTLHD